HAALGPRHRPLLPKVMMSSTTPRILLAGGGSAGHVSPLLATAAQITRRCPDAEITVLGTAQGLEADLVPAAGLELATIDKVPFPRRPDGAALRFPGRFLGTLREVRGLMRERGIDVVAGFGGYVCPPAYLAAASLRRPLVVHEANRRPGLANRLGARRATAGLPALPARPPPGGLPAPPSRGARGDPSPGTGQPPRRAPGEGGPHRLRGLQPAGCATHRHADAGGDRPPRPCRAAGRGGAPHGPGPRPPRAAGDRGIPRRPAAQR